MSGDCSSIEVMTAQGDSKLVLTTGLDTCLVAYPMAEWLAFEKRLSELPQFDADVVTLKPMGLTDMILRGHRLYNGTHLSLPQVEASRASRVEALPADPSEVVLLDVDGETPGKLPATFELLPADRGVILLMAMLGAVILARRQIELTEDEKRTAAGMRRLGHHDDPTAAAGGEAGV